MSEKAQFKVIYQYSRPVVDGFWFEGENHERGLHCCEHFEANMWHFVYGFELLHKRGEE